MLELHHPLMPGNVLSCQCENYDHAHTHEDIETAKLMVPIMLEDRGRVKGVGLAAPQVGISRRFFVMKPLYQPIFVFDPKIVRTGRAQEMKWEGCLSLADRFIQIPRWRILTVNYWTVDALGEFQQVERVVSGLEARIFQHEIDHFDGLLITRFEKTQQESSGTAK